MKRYLELVTTLTLGLLFIVMLVNGIGWAQEAGGNKQASLWSSSKPIPKGMQIQSPPDKTVVVDAVDAKEAQLYDANLRISGAALKPRESNVEWTGAGGGGSIYASSGDDFAIFNVPVYLPQGATVKYFRMYYNDTNASANCNAWFTVYDLYGTVVEEWVVSSTGSAGNDYATTAELTITIDYNLYSYVVNWRPNALGSEMQVCGFNIYYHTPPGSSYVPLTWKGYE